MIRGARERSGYRRAAAGVMGCLLIGSALGVAFQQPVASGASPSPQLRETAQTGKTLTLNTTADEGTEFVMNRRLYDEWAAELERARPEPLMYTVQSGDSMWAVAADHGLDVEALLSLNPEIADADLLHPGQVLVVGGEAARFDSRNAVVSRTASRREAEPVQEPPQLAVEAPPLPQLKAAAVAAPPVAKAAAAPMAAKWVWPISGGLISSEFGGRWGGMHTGLDIAVATGTPAIAAQSGTVVVAGWDGGFGYCVIIDHGDGVKTRYAHASALLVSVGDYVEQGQPVIRVGNTGNSTGPHLHFEVIAEGVPQNPRSYLP